METLGSKNYAALVVDEDTASAEQVVSALAQLGCDAGCVRTMDDAVAAAPTNKWSLVVIAACSLGPDSTHWLRELRNGTTRPHVVLLTDRHDAAALTAAFTAGADDVLAKPLVAAEVSARLRNILDIVALEDTQRLRDGDTALIAEVATRSSLHGQRFLEAQLGNELARARRFAHSLGVVLLGVNPDEGGERDIRLCYRLLADALRARIDWIARHDEWTLALVLPETDLSGALRTAERLRDILLEARVGGAGGLAARPTLHLGVSAVDAEQVARIREDASSLLLEATTAYLREATRRGPNQIAGGPAPYA